MFYYLKNIFNRNCNRCMEKNDINMDELMNLVNKGAILIDVRSPQEYKEGHLENAICIPEYEMYYRCRKEIGDKNAKIIVYCSSGSRSKRAKRELNKMGYMNVYNLYGGATNYKI